MLIPLPVRMGCRCVLGPALCGSLAAGASQVTARFVSGTAVWRFASLSPGWL